ncbi:phosphomevalonate kinase [Auriculariales sp. MPI-PUGE-AT-0066]|nr:phosphomevalonate kinase [Auriculariales sp. MPI-PUGE-AT-0066]
MAPTVVSAPGKVLAAGGYLVLEPQHVGVVISTNARFYTVIQPSETSEGIVVRAPQFDNAIWKYGVESSSGRLQQREGSANKFVQSALETALRVVFESKGPDAVPTNLNITIVGDNDFYSQRAQLETRGWPRTRESLAKLPPFNPPGGTLKDVHKTGLGSSAALTTSLVLAIFAHTGVAQPRDALAHRAAQRAHCVAQGKLGSGFDVAAAAFGSMLYNRFDPAAVPMDDDAPLVPRLRDGALKWDERIAPFALPPGLRVMLADVDAGSDTPSMVGKVLKWKAAQPESSAELWAKLSRANSSFADELMSMGELARKDNAAYLAALNYAASVRHGEWVLHSQPATQAPVLTHLCRVRELINDIRGMMRDMSTGADVPIEPPEQTQLLDACAALQGVVGGGVPGAGGYDAIWVMVVDGGDAAQSVEKLWLGWTEVDVSPLLTDAGAGDDQGARIESLDAVPGLSAVL